jgi:hypothetical protein
MKIVLTTFILFLLLSCVDTVKTEDLHGQYVFTHWGGDTIDIRADGTCRHYNLIDGKQLENNGTWKLNTIGTEIKFEQFSFLTDSMPAGNWYSRLRLDGDEIHLMFASDINAYYKKIKSNDSLRNAHPSNN